MGKAIQCLLLPLMVLMALNTISEATSITNEQNRPSKATAKLTVSALEKSVALVNLSVTINILIQIIPDHFAIPFHYASCRFGC